MRKTTLLLVSVLATCLVGAAQAQNKKKPRSTSNASAGQTTYKWVDENGVTHYGDHIPAQYSQREATVLNSQGVEVQRRLAEMSPEEAAAYRKKQKEEARKKQHDMFLMSTYPSVTEIENVRDARLRQIRDQITASESYVATITSRVDGLKKRAQNFAPYNDKPGARRMPDDLAEEMVRAMSELRTQDSQLAAKRAELKSVEVQFDADIKRFRELRSSSSARNNQVAPKN
jgi:hypothetical protein